MCLFVFFYLQAYECLLKCVSFRIVSLAVRLNNGVQSLL